MNFHKYQALGNTYIVLETPSPLTPAEIRTICHSHYGIGADGILIEIPAKAPNTFGVTIYNPDGSEAEKSGNGLRIFARYLWDELYVADQSFTINTAGGPVSAQINNHDKTVTIEMGHVSFYHNTTCINEPSNKLKDTLTANGRTFTMAVANIGNPHCVVLCDTPPTPRLAQTFGPYIENDSRFPQRTNVQFMHVLNRETIQLEIWERGAGYTLASGSSSCAAAAVAHQLDLIENEVIVQMPGGQLSVTIHPDYTVTMRGPVRKICSGVTELEELIPIMPPLGVS